MIPSQNGQNYARQPLFKQGYAKLIRTICSVLVGMVVVSWGWALPAIATPLMPLSTLSSPLAIQGDERVALVSDSVTSNKAIALHFAEDGWGTNPHWREVWDDVMPADVVYHFNSWSEPIVGLATNKAFNADLFQGFPALHQTIEDVIAEGDTVIYRTTLKGKNTGEFLGMPPTGRSVSINSFTMLRIADSKIAEWWYECNLLEVMQQLGLQGISRQRDD